MNDHQPRIYCDMTQAPDTAKERLDEYRTLFEDALIARERTVAGIRFRFRDDDGVTSRVQNLAAKEKACCAFFDFDVTRVGGEVLWDARVIDDDTARQVLDEFYELPQTSRAGLRSVHDRFASRGLHVQIREGAKLRMATPRELGLSDDDP